MDLRTPAACLFLLVLGCSREQELVSSCLEGARCRPCASDDECVIRSWKCDSTASCVHRDLPVPLYPATEDDDCVFEYDPPEASCVCIDAVCQEGGPR